MIIMDLENIKLIFLQFRKALQKRIIRESTILILFSIINITTYEVSY